MNRFVIYKEAIAQHAIEDACLLREQHRVITAHVLAGAAFEIIQRVALDTTEFSVVKSFWDAVKTENKDNKFCKVKRAYNFFKHADFDIDKEIEFDPHLTDHFLYLSILDLMRVAKAHPERDGYILKVSDKVVKFFSEYKLDHGQDRISLVEIERLATSESDSKGVSCAEYIRKWLKAHTDL